MYLFPGTGSSYCAKERADWPIYGEQSDMGNVSRMTHGDPPPSASPLEQQSSIFVRVKQ